MPRQAAPVLLTELLSPDRVVVPLPAGDRQTAIAVLSRHLARIAGAEYEEVLGAVLERESVLSTGIGFGVAIPHGRSAAVRGLTMVAGVAADRGCRSTRSTASRCDCSSSSSVRRRRLVCTSRS